ncbi:hydantoinase B/oxoprolinase family protein [Amylibacter sp.]|jgi:N-methylhydantoinase B|nr:hydantoinase B/oxoprolinase family protein [Amylibacter sp.]MDC1264902.1 hydantoinase B/oxoprolinase family protein [Amylibacter sp.]MDC1489050.1 hydantoinase B/oxoprolinase family protein [Amylibacter sp.]|tara:strand:+ start:3646 stop:5331 length:1686 start_codon:yes stop_codon:yes gene_type:complete
MNHKSTELDPIRLEIIANGLRSIADECFVALMRSSYSTNIKERKDHSVAIVDKAGRLVVQAELTLPIHIASMGGLMKCVLEKFGDDIHEGDIFVANDPHTAGGTHLPDINYAMPIFIDGEIVAFICNIAHHADIGGMVPGSMAGGMSEIYQEGLRIPVVRLFNKGKLQQDIMDILLLNVRVPEERAGDHNAQIASCRLGERRFKEVVSVQSLPSVLTAFDEIIARTNKRMRDTISQIPDGVYEFKDYLDSDGLETFDIPICLKLNVNGEKIHLDFAGTSPQVKGNVNTTLNAVQASVNYALIGALDSDMPSNQGALDAVDISCNAGTILNCVFPAPVAARAHVCQRVIDITLGALSKAIPDKVIAAANGANTTAVFSGVDPRTNKPYLYFETIGGGMGARATKDGKDGVQVGITNTSNLPVESIEQEYPLRVEEYGFVEDSGGAGKFRGGMGLHRVLTPVDHECVFNGAGERFRYQPWGLFGGKSGGAGKFMFEDSEGKRRLDDKPNEVEVKPGTKITVETPGAGGYGKPSDRAAEAIAQDEQSGKFSKDYITKNYGTGGQ